MTTAAKIDNAIKQLTTLKGRADKLTLKSQEYSRVARALRMASPVDLSIRGPKWGADTPATPGCRAHSESLTHHGFQGLGQEVHGLTTVMAEWFTAQAEAYAAQAAEWLVEAEALLASDEVVHVDKAQEETAC